MRQSLILGAALAALIVAGAASAQELTAITGGKVLTGTSVIENGAVVIQNGRVVANTDWRTYVRHRAN